MLDRAKTQFPDCRIFEKVDLIEGLRGIEWVIFGTDRTTKPRFT